MQCEQSTTVFSMPIRVLQQLLIWEWKRKTHPTFFLFFLFFIVFVPLLPKKVTYQVSLSLRLIEKLGLCETPRCEQRFSSFLKSGVTCMQFDREYRFLRIFVEIPLFAKDEIASFER